MNRVRPSMNVGDYVNRCYQLWLLERVIIDCWTTRRCAQFLGRCPLLVQRDLDKFIDKDVHDPQRVPL